MTRFVPGVKPPPAGRGRAYVIRAGSLAIARDGDRPAVPVVSVDDAWIYLGALDGEPCFARALPAGEPAPDGTELVGLRQLHGALPEDDFAIAGRALALAAWDEQHRYCGRCGTATARSTEERSRLCASCGLAHYPRLSPAVIALIERDGQALLARNARFPGAFHSCLAGFVEVGESLEETVHREIHEEAGITVADLRYAGSQGWPFTNSLMIGFTARWAGGEIVADGAEIVDAGWFGPDELPPLPPRLSIARALIDAFVDRSRA